jgi:hypothetical protein
LLKAPPPIDIVPPLSTTTPLARAAPPPQFSMDKVPPLSTVVSNTVPRSSSTTPLLTV